MDADPIPIAGLDELDEHLDELLEDPVNTPSTVKLFDDVRLQLTPSHIPVLMPRLLPKIIDILKKYQKDPDALCSLATKLLIPLTFSQAMCMVSEDTLIRALRSSVPSLNILAMTVLEKASKSPAEAAILAMMKNLMTSFVTQWLSTPDVGVSAKGTKILGDLLNVDCEMPLQEDLSVNGSVIAFRHPPGQGLVWRRIFHDRDIYSLLLSMTSPGPYHNPVDGISSHELTHAQSRLLIIVPRLAALNLGATVKTNFPDLHQKYSNVETDEGLLHFAALRMVNREDPLMDLIRLDFFESLVRFQCATPYSAFKMDTLKRLMQDATRDDDRLKETIMRLPNQPVTQDVPELRRFIDDIMQS